MHIVNNILQKFDPANSLCNKSNFDQSCYFNYSFIVMYILVLDNFRKKNLAAVRHLFS